MAVMPKGGKRRLLICGATGFIGRNLLKHFLRSGRFEIAATYRGSQPPLGLSGGRKMRWVKADLATPAGVVRAVSGADVILQAAATTSGAKDIVSRPQLHVTGNAVMNSLLLRAAYEHKVGHVVFFSCTVMYAPSDRPAREEDFSGEITEKYFGAGWTKVYIEKMCEFYSRLGATRFTAIRHSNVYGPHDKYDRERSHVMGATVSKVMSARNGKVTVWGDGSEARDLLHVADLVEFVDLSLARQKTPFEVVNVGSGRAVSVRELVRRVIKTSGRRLKIEFDPTKPTIPFRVAVDCARAKRLFDWTPRTSLDEGIRQTLDWYRQHHAH